MDDDQHETDYTARREKALQWVFCTHWVAMNADDLRTAFERLPNLDPQIPWDKHRAALRKQVAGASNKSIGKFLRWSVLHATMFVGEAPYIRKEYDELMKGDSFWRWAMREPKLGKPPFLSYATWTSGNLVHQAYHIKQWMDATGRSIADLSSIVEIGAGYGAMTLLCRRLGFDGSYFCHDFIEFSLLQEYYLSNLFGGRQELRTDANVAKLPDKCDLLIALFSLSEMSFEAREPLMSIDADSYLITYQPQWDGRDNVAYFDEFKEKRNDLQWREYFNPYYVNHRYLIGYSDDGQGSKTNGDSQDKGL